MQQTREELLRLAFDCVARAARLLDLAEEDLLVMKGEERRYGVRGGAARTRRSKTSLPATSTLTGSGISSPRDAVCRA
jgi:hypothetical protein